MPADWLNPLFTLFQHISGQNLFTITVALNTFLLHNRLAYASKFENLILSPFPRPPSAEIELATSYSKTSVRQVTREVII